MMEGLGRLFDIAPIAAGTLISLKDAAGISFCCTGNDTFTVNSASTYNGSTSTLTAITRYYKCSSTSGGAVWTDSGDVAAVDAVTISSGVVVFYIDAADLPSGAEYVSVTVGASGLVFALTHDLLAPRTPANLRQLSGSAS